LIVRRATFASTDNVSPTRNVLMMWIVCQAKSAQVASVSLPAVVSRIWIAAQPKSASTVPAILSAIVATTLNVPRMSCVRTSDVKLWTHASMSRALQIRRASMAPVSRSLNAISTVIAHRDSDASTTHVKPVQTNA